ncbi:MAG: thiamine pyrophosphate-dependent dehydrogenase E1 component subunit alpha [Lentisphaeria bacterium]|nr:thiamine pyrophosphate-dependent dehydrogenase E1 component subunit alpha [Lentisphaeria bacterium]NQZ69022.1 thiamine pyrophosphate-dependent dehydrogenase E1 component subunit alpha [Lentisphaeria bacterium]
MATAAPDLKDDKLLELYRQMLTIRGFEQAVLESHKKRLVQGAAHTYIGMEAVAVGVCAALQEDDYITSTHRGHGHCIARGLEVNRMLAEIFGRATGYCKGKGGSMHIADLDRGMLGADGIVGGGIPIAMGAALGCRVRNTSQVVACFFGEGASNQGSFHEAINMAAIRKLPVIFVCENNHWALSAEFEVTTAVANVADRASAYSIPGHIVDGNNVLDVYDTAAEAVQRARSGEGPSLIECKTYRWEPHSVYATKDPRPPEEVEEWKAKDPILRFHKLLSDREILNTDQDETIRNDVDQLIEDAVDFASNSPDPDPADAVRDVFV